MRSAFLLLTLLSAAAALELRWTPLTARASASLIRASPTLQGDFDYTKSAEARRLARAAKEGGIDPEAGAEQMASQVPPPLEQPRAAPPATTPQLETVDEQELVQMAVDAAAASAADVLRAGGGEITSTTVARMIVGFSAKIRELAEQSASGVPGPSPAAPAPAAAPAAAAPAAAVAAAAAAVAAAAAAPAAAAPAPTPAAAAAQASNDADDRNMLAQVLLEFVQAPYAKRLIEEGDVQPLIGAPSKQLIGIVFESVKLNDNRLEVRLKRNFEQRSERLLEKLVKHLQERMPQLEQLLFVAKSPPSTRTIILSRPQRQ